MAFVTHVYVQGNKKSCAVSPNDIAQVLPSGDNVGGGAFPCGPYYSFVIICDLREDAGVVLWVLFYRALIFLLMNLPVVQFEFHEPLVIGFHAKCWLASMAFGESRAEVVGRCRSPTQRYALSASSLLGPDLPCTWLFCGKQNLRSLTMLTGWLHYHHQVDTCLEATVNHSVPNYVCQ